MNNLIFRKINSAELIVAYDLHCERVKDMVEKGIKQWLKPIEFSKLEERQKKQENFGLFLDKQLEVFLSLTKRQDYHEWSHILYTPGTTWLNTVSVKTKSKHKGLGKIAVIKAVEYLKSKGVYELYLDCVINNGFLVNYYKDLGFEVLAETKAVYKSGTFEVALMRLKIT